MYSSPHVSIRSIQEMTINSNNISTENEEKKSPQSLDLISSFVVVYTMIFFNGCCFTAVVPSVPFYLQYLHAPPEFLGWVVSFYSLGQVFGSPTAGWLVSDDESGKSSACSSKRLLTFSSTLGLISSAMYTVAPSYNFILISRLLTGFSAGMEFTTELTFIANNTTPSQRTAYLASVTACNVVGFIMGPAISMILSNAINIEVLGGLVTVNEYTAPGWLLVAMFMLDLVMVRFFFTEHAPPGNEYNSTIRAGEKPTMEMEKEGLLDKKSQSRAHFYGGVRKSEDTESSTPAHHNDAAQECKESEPPPPLLLVLSLIFVQFSFMCGFSLLETITSPLVQDEFDWNIQECNLLFTAGGFVSLSAYVAFVLLSKCVQDRRLVVTSLVLSFAGFFLGVDWQQLEWVPDSLAETLLPAPYLIRFLLGFALMNGGFMTGRPVVFALYSKLIARQYQGKYLGWMVAGGSVARTLGPFAAVYLYYNVEGAGENLLALFGSFVVFHSACLALVLWQWPQLLPSSPEQKPSEMPTRTPMISTSPGPSVLSKDSTKNILLAKENYLLPPKVVVNKPRPPPFVKTLSSCSSSRRRMMLFQPASSSSLV
jgi:MFS family permease